MNAPAAIRLATFNVENLREGDGGGSLFAERVRMLKPQVLRLRADILCLQEVDGQRHVKGERRRLSALDALIEDTPYAAFHRVTTTSRSSGEVRDRHNLVILSRFPFAEQRQVFHDLVAPPHHRLVAGDTPAAQATVAVEWDRPFLYAALHLEGGGVLHVVNVHLRAPRAAFLAGQKNSARSWRTMAAWAEGFFLAAVKRVGQALEARLFIDQLFDAEPEPLIAVVGDFNADSYEMPVRIVRGDEEDAGNPHLALRTLVAVERSIPDSRRFTVVHHGRPQMLDHLLVSRPLLAWYRGLEIHNEALGDELITAHAVSASPESFHAPMVAEFEITRRPDDSAA
jgi:endonuclease/exonuclease/phosphatase family metal-dependent hydrolase